VCFPPCAAARAPYLNSAFPPRRCFSSAPIHPLAKQVHKMSLTQHIELPNGVKYDQPLGLYVLLLLWICSVTLALLYPY
jgi:hypothetical protein